MSFKNVATRFLTTLGLLLGAASPVLAQSATAPINDWGYDGRVQMFKNGIKAFGLNYNVRAVTTATDTVTLTDLEVSDNATSNAITETLPSAAGVPSGHMVVFKKTDSSGNAVTIARAGTDLIDGVTSVSLPQQYDSLVLQSDGVSNWIELSGSVHVGNITGQHLVGNSATPSLATNGGGCNTPSAPVIGTFNGGLGSKATDLAGEVGATCGGTGATSSTTLAVTFSVAYVTPPSCLIAPANAATASIPVADAQFVQSTAAKLLVKSNTTGLPTGTYLWTYACAQ